MSKFYPASKQSNNPLKTLINDEIPSIRYQASGIRFPISTELYGSLSHPRILLNGSGIPENVVLNFPENETSGVYPKISGNPVFGLTYESIQINNGGSGNNIGDEYFIYSDAEIEIGEEAINVAVLAINKPEMYKEFMEFIDSFVKGNWFDPQEIETHGFERILQTIHSSSLITFVEQRLFASFVKSKGYSTKTILNLVYDGGDQRWIGDDMINPNITHLWGWKTSYRTPEMEADRLSLTDSLLGTLKDHFRDSYTKYIEKGNILKCCER
jgi:hypothetical protein